MTSILRIFGFPPPEQRDSVRFYFAKNLSYNTRINVVVMSLMAGFVIQIVTMNPLGGIPFLIISVGLALVKGYDSRIRLKTWDLDPNWTEVSIKEIRELEDLRKASTKWDQDPLDISNTYGCIIFILLLFGIPAVSIALGFLVNDVMIPVILITDAIILLIPLWFTGMRFIMKQPKLAIRVKIILKLADYFETIAGDKEEFKPSLMMARDKDGKMIPTDARFSISLPDRPKGLYGLQAQINLNVVQGTNYPYFYCVIAAKPGFGLGQFKNRIKLMNQIICEYQEDEKAEVLVIRQHTTKKSGYHTSDKRCREILSVSLEGARKVISG